MKSTLKALFGIALLFCLTAANACSAASNEDASTVVSWAYASHTLSENESEKLMSLLDSLSLDQCEAQSVEDYYGSVSASPGESFELTFLKQDLQTQRLALVSNLLTEEVIIHRYDNNSESLEVLDLTSANVRGNYAQVYSYAEQLLYDQMITGELLSAHEIKAVNGDNLFFIEDEEDRDFVNDKLLYLLQNNVDRTIDQKIDWKIEWELVDEPLALYRIEDQHTWQLQFVDDISAKSISLLPELGEEKAVLLYTDLNRSIALKYEIPEEKAENFHELLEFLEEL